ncbi:hypothetical protein [Epilithonimonas hominis]|uniref:hypothetical protein n=1 Tax=Epilithonimonas hominis TaxID=420404 RepID=UPI000ED5CAD7|nr:hypothetical protein [Epilithonimonas hominis]MBP7498267.1 hypothetical protein [Chryseobacterium sp.]HAP95786.1 hypothetical protein [Chryseobacterium sp.]
MKKLLLVATIGIAGLVSANTITVKSESDKKSQNKKEVVAKKETKKILKSEALSESECRVFYASCTAAITCQEWNPYQWFTWAQAIQENYCQL